MKTSINGLATLAVLAFPVWLYLDGVQGDDPARLTLHLTESDVRVWIDDDEYPVAQALREPISVYAGSHQLRVMRGRTLLFVTQVDLQAGERKEIWARWRPRAALENKVASHLGVDVNRFPSLNIPPSATALPLAVTNP